MNNRKLELAGYVTTVSLCMAVEQTLPYDKNISKNMLGDLFVQNLFDCMFKFIISCNIKHLYHNIKNKKELVGLLLIDKETANDSSAFAAFNFGFKLLRKILHSYFNSTVISALSVFSIIDGNESYNELMRFDINAITILYGCKILFCIALATISIYRFNTIAIVLFIIYLLSLIRIRQYKYKEVNYRDANLIGALFSMMYILLFNRNKSLFNIVRILISVIHVLIDTVKKIIIRHIVKEYPEEVGIAIEIGVNTTNIIMGCFRNNDSINIYSLVYLLGIAMTTFLIKKKKQK